ncbi:hypothetical protein M758_6G068500 [Ceratodon purpureus]|nr:hypothetical protein M758_6G068500 [Ceratodon purpureus]
MSRIRLIAELLALISLQYYSWSTARTSVEDTISERDSV